ncbi:ABC transporter permease [Legionella impletisoli]|uniref:Peptide ABC transporter permease n=1 Tax=Legionella impletisoli TaxID=343510 RepID=A0A917JP67_9GAMM|nr:ABC transporter permease [Legionella impletisoli]GGI78915.1 peptide ABC transporter permease [Legionella impletisoli]
MTLDLLWTDQCFLVLVIISTGLILRSLKNEPVRRSFKQIISKPIPVSAGIILLIFLVIGILDSIQFKTAESIRAASLLDKLLAPLDSEYEKTYSAPLSLHLYSTEMVFEEGSAKQIYPRLHYPPAFLQNQQEVQPLVIKILSGSALVAFLGVVVIWFLMVFYRAIRHYPKLIYFSSASLSALITLFVSITILMSTYWLSRYLHVLGTGKIGQDVFYYAIKSIRTGLVIGTLTTLFMMPLALILGISAGYFGGFIDDVIQYIYTTLSSIPGVLLITASVLSMQTFIANHPEQFTTLAQSADARLLALCFILGVTSWTSLCRLLRAEALKLREIDYVLAAQALGSSSIKILFKHLLPNVMHIVVITLVLDFSFLVLAEAVLSYVGVGVSPLTISWGNMINAARLELAREPIVWWPMFAAFVFMFVLVLASNLFADAVRDAFDPKQAGIE